MLCDLSLGSGAARARRDGLGAFLPEHEFALPGQLVADAAVTAVDHRLEPPRMQVSCELLLLEEG